MRISTYLSLGLTALAAAWLLSGVLVPSPEREPVPEASKRVIEKTKVTVLDIGAREITREIVLQGELEPRRQVEIRAQTASRVIGLPMAKGDRVTADAVLVELAAEDRDAQLARAQAEVRSKELEVDAARKLESRGLQAENRVKIAEAALAGARAELERARLELDYIRIEAPFAGVLERRYVELGSQVANGDSVALVVDDAVLKAVGRVSQQSAGKLRLGQRIHVKLLDGREATGSLTYIARVGDAETHSFRVEADVPNESGLLNAGVSAELRIAIGREAAHFVSPAVLALDDSGAIGVKTVTGDGVVEFHKVTLVRTAADGVWITGLPARARVINRGQGFVNTGETVVATPAT